jgi:hypothetical protein
MDIVDGMAKDLLREKCHVKFEYFVQYAITLLGGLNYIPMKSKALYKKNPGKPYG